VNVDDRYSARSDAVYSVAEGVSLTIAEPQPPALVIGDPERGELVRLEIVDGRMTARYDPADLDEAARVFWDAMARYFPTRDATS
jgi:hypothetical protein